MGPPSTVSEYISPSGVLSVDIESGSRSLIGEPPLDHPRRLLVPVWTDLPVLRRESPGTQIDRSTVAASYQNSRQRKRQTGMVRKLAPRGRDQRVAAIRMRAAQSRSIAAMARATVDQKN